MAINLSSDTVKKAKSNTFFQTERLEKRVHDLEEENERLKKEPQTRKPIFAPWR